MDSILRFYILANTLKQKLRTGWQDVHISAERLESIAEHVYGTLVLAIAVDSEYKLGLDMTKVLKTLTLHELEEIIIPDYSYLSKVTKEEKILSGNAAVKNVVEGLISADEIEKLLEEFNNKSTKEGKFCHLIDKLECDFQAKLYDLNGNFDIEEAKKDSAAWNPNYEEIKNRAVNASDFWIEGNLSKFKHNPVFNDLIMKIKNLKKTDLEEI